MSVIRRTEDAWRVSVRPTIRFANSTLLTLYDESLGYESRYYAVLWVSLLGPSMDPRLEQVRIKFARSTSEPALLVASHYAPMQRGSLVAQKNQVFPKGGLELGCKQPGIPSVACIEVVVRCDVPNDGGMLAQDTIGSSSISLLQLHYTLKNQQPPSSKDPIKIRVPLVLHASQDTSVAVLELDVIEAHFDQARLHEVFDAAMMPMVASAVLNGQASLGWIHLPREDLTGDERLGDIMLKDVGLPGLIPVAARSMVPYCNESPGNELVDTFFSVKNPASYPRPSEAEWVRVAEQAYWLRGLTIAQVNALLERNLASDFIEPEFELVISGYSKMFSMRGTSFPYRSDIATQLTKTGKPVRKGTDYFWQCESQRSGDCEDSAKTIKDREDVFMSTRFQDKTLCQLQRLGACWVPGGMLANVTSPSLKNEDGGAEAVAAAPKGAAAKKVTPVCELECGLHAVCLDYPLMQLREELSRTVQGGMESVRKLNFFAGLAVTESQLPKWAAHVGMLVNEGTGLLDARTMAFRTYIEGHLQRMGPTLAKQHLPAAEKLIQDRERQMQVTRWMLGMHPKMMQGVGAKPEMMQFNVEYKYDYHKIFSGEASQLSHFYVTGVEFYTDRLLAAGHRHGRFVLVSRNEKSNAQQRPNPWLKEALFDSIVAGDARVALWPQPALTNEALKSSMILGSRLEPIGYVDHNEDDAAVDALIRHSEEVFGSSKVAPTGANLVWVDFHLQNGVLDAENLKAHVDAVATELRASGYVKATEFRRFDHGAGITSGVIRLHVDYALMERAVQARVSSKLH